MTRLLKRSKWVAWVIMLTFLFTSFMPTNLFADGNVANAAEGDIVIDGTEQTKSFATQKEATDFVTELQAKLDELNKGKPQNEQYVAKIGTIEENVEAIDEFEEKGPYTTEEEAVVASKEFDTDLVGKIYSKATGEVPSGGIDVKYDKNNGKTGSNITKFSFSAKQGYFITKQANDKVVVWTEKELTLEQQVEFKKDFLAQKGSTDNSVSDASTFFFMSLKDGKEGKYNLQEIFPNLSDKEEGKGPWAIEIEITRDGDLYIVKYSKPISHAYYGEAMTQVLGYYFKVQKTATTYSVTYKITPPDTQEQTPATGSLTISKVVTGIDKDTQEQKFKFALSSNALVDYAGEVQVGEKKVNITKGVIDITVPVGGTVMVTGLPQGEYTLVEDTTNRDIYKGYTLNSVEMKAEQSNVICSGNNAEFTVTEQAASFAVKCVNNYVPEGKTGSFQFTKVDAEKDNVLAGAEFTLYSNEGCTEQVATVTSDANGVVVFENLALNEALGYTGYYMKETKTPDGYMDSNVVYIVTLDKNGALESIIYRPAAGEVANSITPYTVDGWKITNTPYPPATTEGDFAIKKTDVKFVTPEGKEAISDEVQNTLSNRKFAFDVRLAVITTGSALQFNSFDEVKAEAARQAEDTVAPKVKSFSVISSEITWIEELINNIAEFRVTGITKDEQLDFDMNAVLSTGSAMIWAEITEVATVALEDDDKNIDWSASGSVKDKAFEGNNWEGNSWFGQLTSGSVYQFVNTYTSTKNTTTGGGDNGNTGGGGDNGNTDEDNETVITDPDVPLVNVPEEPIEEIEIEIGEPEVPLTEAPGEPVAIEEPEVPLGDAPKTGDSSNAVLFVALMLAAGAGLVVTRRKFN